MQLKDLRFISFAVCVVILLCIQLPQAATKTHDNQHNKVERPTLKLSDRRFRSPERMHLNALHNRALKGRRLATFKLPSGESSRSRPELEFELKRHIVTGDATNTTCTMCLEAFEFIHNVTTTHGGDWLYENIVPVCDVIWPYIPSIIQKDYCNVENEDECRDLCVGMLYSWRNVVADIIASLYLTPQPACERLNMCPHVEPPTPVRPVYPKTIVQATEKPSPDTHSMRIFHISDIHWDHYYTVGSKTDCGLPVCCHPKYKPVNGDGAGIWGDYACDAPEVLIKSALAQIGEHDVQHVIFTGDEPAHDLWLQTHESNIEAVLNVTNWAVDASLKAGKIKYWPSLGNHAAAPVNEFGGPAKDFWLYGPVADNWSKFLPRSAEITVRWGGFYTAPMEPGLHMIALQTNYYDSLNFYLKLSDHWDIAGQMGWFEDVLEQIDNLGEKAIIIGHEKPGAFMEGIWPEEMTRIISKYSHIIVGLYFGHNHNDMFHVVKSTSPSKKHNVGEACGVVMIPSALSPVERSTEPSYRVYMYEGSTKTLLDYQQYRMNLTEANKRGYPSWSRAYSARVLFGMKDLSPASWQDVAHRMATNQTLYQIYRNVYHGGIVDPEFSEAVDRNSASASCFLSSNLDREYHECLQKMKVSDPHANDFHNVVHEHAPAHNKVVYGQHSKAFLRAREIAAKVRKP